jgi:tol-pal system protein YbgF
MSGFLRLKEFFARKKLMRHLTLQNIFPAGCCLSSESVGKTTSLLPALLFIMALAAFPARAQDTTDLRNEMSRLRQDVADLQRQLASGGRGSVSSSAGQSAVAPVGNETVSAKLKVQVDQMYQELRGVIGQIEQLNFQIEQIGTKVDKLAADVEFRLAAIERGGGVAPASPRDGGLSGQTPPAQPQGSPSAPVSPGVADLDSGLSDLPPPSTATTLQGSRTPPPPPGLSGASPQGSPEQQYAAAFGLLRAGDYAAAADGMDQFLKNNPGHELAGNATYWLGETYYVRKDYQSAATHFMEGFEKYPQSRKAPDNLLKLGMTLAALDHKAEACQALGEVRRKYPKAPEKVLQRAGIERERLNCS